MKTVKILKNCRWADKEPHMPQVVGKVGQIIEVSDHLANRMTAECDAILYETKHITESILENKSFEEFSDNEKLEIAEESKLLDSPDDDLTIEMVEACEDKELLFGWLRRLGVNTQPNTGITKLKQKILNELT